MIDCVILAAGNGTRMKSDKPKVLHEVMGKPMIQHTIDNFAATNSGNIIVVVSDPRTLEADGALYYIMQKKISGTAHSAWAGIERATTDNVVVLYGDDTAFYKPDTYIKVINKHFKSKAVVTFITLKVNDPTGKGRILKDLRIVEDKDATESQKRIKEVNDGVYVFNRRWFLNNISKVDNNNAQKEYYLTDMINIAIQQNKKVETYRLKDTKQHCGINTQQELRKANERN